MKGGWLTIWKIRAWLKHYVIEEHGALRGTKGQYNWRKTAARRISPLWNSRILRPIRHVETWSLMASVPKSLERGNSYMWWGLGHVRNDVRAPQWNRHIKNNFQSTLQYSEAQCVLVEIFWATICLRLK